MIYILSIFICSVFSKLIEDNLPNLHWKNITTFIIITSYIYLIKKVNQKYYFGLSYKLFKLHNAGIIKLKKKEAWFLAISLFVMAFFKNSKFSKPIAKPLLLLNPANYNKEPIA